MTTGPRNTPHPIILHVDAQGNPVRLAEASAIYTTNVSAVTLVATNVCATNWIGLESVNGFPGGPTFAIQYKGADNNFAGESVLSYNPTTNTLAAQNIYVGNVTSIEAASFADVKAASLSSTTLNSITLNTNTVNSTDIRAITLSATTVCAVNYDAQFDALSFSNLDNRYLNSSGDSVTGSFVVQALSATTISATNYLNLPSASAIWNASSIQGRSVTATAPSFGESLVWLGTAWGPSAVAGGAGGSPGDPNLSIQFKNGAFFSGTSNVTYNQSISGIQSLGLSSTNLTSRNISATIVSSTTYLNLGEDEPIWNASKIQDFEVLKTSPQEGDILVVNGAINSWVTKSPSEYADYIYPVIQNRIPSAAAVWNASSLRGYQVTSTAPISNQLLMYNGTAWIPTSSTFNLGTVNTTNSTASVLTAVTGTITTLSATNARATGLSATTISATNWQGLPSSVATWNASAIRGATVLSPDAGGLSVDNPLGLLIYNRISNEYGAVPFNTPALNGTRDADLATTQGKIVASYLTSASDQYFALNPIWNATPLTPGSVPDLPTSNDVLVYKTDLYGYGNLNAWTWVQPSTLSLAAGSNGYVQYAGPAGSLSGDSNFTYNSTTKTLVPGSSVVFPGGGAITLPSGTIFLGAPESPTYISNQGINTRFLQVLGGLNSPSIVSPYVSATRYTIFGKDTSSTGSPSRDNQTITYDFSQNKWKPGYTIYQATGIPSDGLGSDGDIYFQYLP